MSQIQKKFIFFKSIVHCHSIFKNSMHTISGNALSVNHDSENVVILIWEYEVELNQREIKYSTIMTMLFSISVSVSQTNPIHHSGIDFVNMSVVYLRHSACTHFQHFHFHFGWDWAAFSSYNFFSCLLHCLRLFSNCFLNKSIPM